MTDDEALALRLAERVLATAGIVELYPTNHALWAVAAEARAAVVGRPRTSADKVAVSRTEEGIEIRVHIGVSAQESTPAVTRRVSEELDAAVRELLGPDARPTIYVQVSSIG